MLLTEHQQTADDNSDIHTNNQLVMEINTASSLPNKYTLDDDDRTANKLTTGLKRHACDGLIVTFNYWVRLKNPQYSTKLVFSVHSQGGSSSHPPTHTNHSS